jgi:hypothetical protein
MSAPARTSYQASSRSRSLDQAYWSQNDTKRSIVPFESGERAKIEIAEYHTIANVGDQDSDLAGGFAECSFQAAESVL